MATRFINSVQFPLRHGDNLETYLTAPPRVPENLPQGISSFLQRVVVQDAQTQASIIVTQLLEPPLEEGPPPVILDLDAFREAEFAPGGREAWACLEELRGLKNRFFFASLTARALESYS